MEAVLQITVPVFFIILIGFLFTRWRQPRIDLIGAINIELFVPVLLIYVLSEKLPALNEIGPIIIAGVVVVLGSGLLVWPVLKLFNLDVRLILPPVMFNNSGNLGLPLAVLAFGDKALPWAVALFVVQVLLQFTVGVLILERRLNPVVLLKNPIFMSTLVGIVMYLTDLHIPSILLPGVKMLSDVAIPLMLIVLGGHLASAGFEAWKVGLIGAILTPLSGLIAAFAAIWLLPIPLEQQGLVILFGALPPAVMNAVLAQQYDLDRASSASIVAMGNVFSVVVLTTVLYVLAPSV